MLGLGASYIRDFISAVSVEIQYLCQVRYGLIVPMHRNKPNIAYLLTYSVFAEEVQKISRKDIDQASVQPGGG